MSASDSTVKPGLATTHCRVPVPVLELKVEPAGQFPEESLGTVR